MRPHKVLDAIGDLALAGLPMLGAYRSVRGGHKLNHAVLTALLADRSAWRVVEAETARRSRTHAEAGRGMAGAMIARPMAGRVLKPPADFQSANDGRRSGTGFVCDSRSDMIDRKPPTNKPKGSP